MDASPGPRVLRAWLLAAAVLALAAHPREASAASSAPAAVYEPIPGESRLMYQIKHPMHKVKGVSKDFLCRVSLAQDTVSSHVVVSADVRSFDSGNFHRDDHVLEVIHANQYPKVDFASDSVRKAPDGFRIYGRLTFAGQTHPVDFTVSPSYETGKVKIAGGFSIKLTDYGVKPPSLAFIATEDKLDISFDLVARDDWAPGGAAHPWNPLPR